MAYEEEVAAVEEEIQQMEAEEAERRNRQSVIDEARKREQLSDRHSSLEISEKKRESFLNPIPELKIENCDSQESCKIAYPSVSLKIQKIAN